MQAKLLVKLFKFKYQGLLHTSVLHLAYSWLSHHQKSMPSEESLASSCQFCLDFLFGRTVVPGCIRQREMLCWENASKQVRRLEITTAGLSHLPLQTRILLAYP